MGTEEVLSSIVGTLIARLPVLIVWAAGVVIAVVRWQRHRRVSMLLVLGLAILFVNSIVAGFLDVWLPIQLFRGGTHPPRVGLILTGRNILQSLIGAAGWALVLVAALAERPAAPSAAAEA